MSLEFYLSKMHNHFSNVILLGKKKFKLYYGLDIRLIIFQTSCHNQFHNFIRLPLERKLTCNG